MLFHIDDEVVVTAKGDQYGQQGVVYAASHREPESLYGVRIDGKDFAVKEDAMKLVS